MHGKCGGLTVDAGCTVLEVPSSGFSGTAIE